MSTGWLWLGCFSDRQSGYSSFSGNYRFWVRVFGFGGCSGQNRRTSHAPDASPRSVSTLFFAHSVFSVSWAGPRGKAPVMPAVRPLFVFWQ